MKFGKEFLSQMVPEWQEAYLDYDNLKAVLAEVNISKQPRASDVSGKLKRKVSLYRAFSGLTGRRHSPRKQDDAIITNIVQKGSEESYQSMFFMSSDRGGENEVVFFRRLDDEFNKVVRFYNKKVGELMVEAEELSTQMDILIALRIKVEKPDVAFEDADEHVNLAGTAVSSTSNSTVNSINGRATGKSIMFLLKLKTKSHKCFNSLDKRSLVINAVGQENLILFSYCLDCVLEGRPRLETTQEVETADDAASVDEDMEAKEAKSYRRKGSKGIIEATQELRPASLDLLPHVRINISPETPVSTLKYMVASSKARLSYNKTELRKSEELMTRALIEFYQKLQVLKGYR